MLVRPAAAEMRVIQSMTTPGWLHAVSQNVWNPRDSRLEMTEAGNATRVAYTIGPVAGSTIRGVASFGRSTRRRRRVLRPTAHGSSPPRRSSSTASARSARLFLGPRSLGAE